MPLPQAEAALAMLQWVPAFPLHNAQAALGDEAAGRQASEEVHSGHQAQERSTVRGGAVGGDKAGFESSSRTLMGAGERVSEADRGARPGRRGPLRKWEHLQDHSGVDWAEMGSCCPRKMEGNCVDCLRMKLLMGREKNLRIFGEDQLLKDFLSKTINKTKQTVSHNKMF